jgi:glycosyltransferase involved in cell wall biosynthesis
MSDAAPQPLNILHVLRAPVGGLFRHVLDLARGQIVRGHKVGLVVDSSTGGARAEQVLGELAPKLKLGLMRVAMSRQVGPSDVVACSHVARRAVDVAADVIHGHGAKGGAYVRLARAVRGIRVYTPHGGSLHYDARSPSGFLYLASEREMLPRTDLFLFESAYARDVFVAKIGDPGSRARVVHNGVTPAEFEAVATDPQATDLLFVGELRMLKGVDVLIKALGTLVKEGRRVTASIVGDGPDRKTFEATARFVGGADSAIQFLPPMPAREAFAHGRLLVVPSRAESLPYIVLEAAAAGVPLIATRVGGIPEIFGPDAGQLVPSGDGAALAQAIASALRDPARVNATAERLQARVRAQFSADAMIDAVLKAYREAIAKGPSELPVTRQGEALASRHG